MSVYLAISYCVSAIWCKEITRGRDRKQGKRGGSKFRAKRKKMRKIRRRTTHEDRGLYAARDVDCGKEDKGRKRSLKK